MASLLRVLGGLFVAIPLVGATCFALLYLPHLLSFVSAMLGIALLMYAKTFHSKVAAAVGGVLAMGGILAWGLVAAHIII